MKPRNKPTHFVNIGETNVYKPQCPYCHTAMLEDHMCPGAKESLSRFFAKTMGKIHYTKDGLCEICDVKKIDDGKLHAHVDGVEKPKPGKDFFYGKIKSPPFNLEKFKESAQKAKETFNGLSQQIKDIVDEAYNANLDSEKITKAPVGASGVTSGSSKNYKSIIALAEQRGYERGLVEAHKNDPTGSELDDLLKRTEQEGYDRAKRELSVKYGGQG